MNNFLKLKAKDSKDIDGKIAVATTALKNAQSQKVIASQTELPKITYWGELDFPTLKTDFTKTIDNIQDKALEKVLNEHIEKLKNDPWPKKLRRWLKFQRWILICKIIYIYENNIFRKHKP